jgi:PAS domain-containing protein
MDLRRHKNLVLILAREFASKLATPMFVTDADGNLVYFNEPAELILGRSFTEAGEMAAGDWATLFQVEGVEGGPIELEQMPAGIAFTKREPAHGSIVIRGLNGIRRTISVTAFPLFAHTAEFVGVVAIFWEEKGS